MKMNNSGPKLKDRDKETLFTELHTLLGSGLDFSQVFGLLIRSEQKPRLRELLQRLYDRVVGGDALWRAMEMNGNFTALDTGVVRIGEQTGRLGEALLFLTGYYQRRGAQQRMISSAVSYPLVILLTALAVVAFMLAVIVPMFEQVYSRMGGQLPALTQAVIRFSRIFPQVALVVLLIAGITGWFAYCTRNEERMQALRARLLLRAPVAGQIAGRHYQAHFCKLLYLLCASGIPLLEGVKMLRRVITNHAYRRSFDALCRGLEHGEGFADNLERFPELYDRKLTALIRVGEETNTLPQMLARQAETLTQELEHRLRRMGTLLEPALILLVGLLVAVILVSMYMPMFKLGGIMG